MNYPIDITSQNPNTFSYTPEELGITPVTTLEPIKAPLIVDSEGPVGKNAAPLSIWIGKDANLTLIEGSFPDTYRHEIQSLAFEDDRTDLVKGITRATIEADNDWDLKDENENYYYDLRSLEDSTQIGPMKVWCDGTLYITKSLKLPEGLTTFGKFVFAHTNFDRENDGDYYHNATDFRIFIPSTITSFNIIGSNARDSYRAATSDVDDGSITNTFLFYSYSGDSTGGSLWDGYAGDSLPYPNKQSCTEEDIVQFLEDYPRDAVHIYLRNHTTVPTITFIGNIFFPIVFHVNEAILEDFTQQYAGTVNWNPDYYYDDGYNYDIISIVADYSEEIVPTSQPLSNVNFAPSALSGSYNDLKDKPAIPDFGVLLKDDIEEALAGIHLDWYKSGNNYLNTASTSYVTDRSTYSFTLYFNETNLNNSEVKTVKLEGVQEEIWDTSTYETISKTITINSFNYITRDDTLGTDTVVESIPESEIKILSVSEDYEYTPAGGSIPFLFIKFIYKSLETAINVRVNNN